MTVDEMFQALMEQGHLVIMTWTAEEFKAYLASYKIPISNDEAERILRENISNVQAAMLVASAKQFNKIMHEEFAPIFEEREAEEEAAKKRARGEKYDTNK